MKRPDKREKIIAAAVSLFRQTHNVRKVSLEAIASEARVSPTTIYNVFGTRENLILEVVKILVIDNLEFNRNLIRSSIPFPQKITAIVSGKQDLASRINGEIINKIVSQDEAMTPFIDGLYESEIKPLWLEMLADGKKQGYIDESVDEEALISYLDILKAGVRARPELAQNIIENPGYIENLTRIVFYGFLKKDIDLFKKEGS